MTRSNKILLSVVALGAAIAAFYFFVLAPKREEVAKLDTDIAAQQAEVEQARLTLAGYEAGQEDLQAQLRDARAPRQGRSGRRRRDVDDGSARGYGRSQRRQLREDRARLRSRRLCADDRRSAAPADGQLAAAPGAIPVAGGVLSAMPFSFSFTGSYFDLTAFFARLEHFVKSKNAQLDSTGRLLRLESVTIAPSAVGFPDMQAQINAATYLVPPVQGVTEATTPPAPGTTPPTTTAATTGASR